MPVGLSIFQNDQELRLDPPGVLDCVWDIIQGETLSQTGLENFDLAPSYSTSGSPSNPLTQRRRPPFRPNLPSPVPSSLHILNDNASSHRSGRGSTHAVPIQDILFPGDAIGQGLYFHGERVRLLPIPVSHRNVVDNLNAPSLKFEVVKALGTGSYAVVYQVRQILSSYPPYMEDLSPISAVNFDGLPSSSTSTRYGREYALKCLSKADLDKDALSAQMFEVYLFTFFVSAASL